MTFKNAASVLWAILLLFLCIATQAELAQAKKLYVANNGVDGAACGILLDPCRSISKAIEKATAGDTIVVGPGQYGDLNGDQKFDPASGEEKAELGTGCFCMIKVNKRVTIESRDGARATVLDANGAPASVIQIEASGVVFGKYLKGFTITRGEYGLVTLEETTRVKLTNNIAIGNIFEGFILFGSEHQVSKNIASGNGRNGFEIRGRKQKLANNVARGNRETGILIDGGSGRHQLNGNVVSANRTYGIRLESGDENVLNGNVVHANRLFGILIGLGYDHLITNNSIIGNGEYGLYVYGRATITKNNIFGNGEGLWNTSGTAITATNNFWGAADGPGDNPADGFYTDAQSTTLFEPFATKEYRIKPLTPLDERGLIALGTLPAKTLYVANNGIDSLNCGSISAPCRSISKALAQANEGDKIIVGPGRYGDLNNDGFFESLYGEEEANIDECSCMIKVDKRVTIESRDGAGATVLDARESTAATIIVSIESSGTIFGKKDKGFTIINAYHDGLSIAEGATGVNVAGNIATANIRLGFNIRGTGHTINHNIAEANGRDGFRLGGSENTLNGNVASENGGNGFYFFGNGHVFRGNVSAANEENGFYTSNGISHTFKNNLALASRDQGFYAAGGGDHLFSDNAVIGNRHFGIYLYEGIFSTTITRNNLFGNNARSYGSTPYGELVNCGLFNQTGNVLFNATQNFWGSSGGPGPDIIGADKVCNYGPGSATTYQPFATKEFKIKTLAPVDETGFSVPADAEQDEISETPSLVVRTMQEKATLVFQVSEAVSALRLELADLSGKKIYDSGFVLGQTLRWARVTSQGRPLALGVYLYRLSVRDPNGTEIRSELRKLLLFQPQHK
jgi:parallel beta-helix repeat protein